MCCDSTIRHWMRSRMHRQRSRRCFRTRRNSTALAWRMGESLFLEEVVEGFASAAGAGGRKFRRRGGSRSRRGCGGCVLLDGHAERVEAALVARVLARDTLGDRLRAFELRAGIEMHALL